MSRRKQPWEERRELAAKLSTFAVPRGVSVHGITRVRGRRYAEISVGRTDFHDPERAVVTLLRKLIREPLPGLVRSLSAGEVDAVPPSQISSVVRRAGHGSISRTLQSRRMRRLFGRFVAFWRLGEGLCFLYPDRVLYQQYDHSFPCGWVLFRIPEDGMGPDDFRSKIASQREARRKEAPSCTDHR